ncbi:hypothetical protein J2Z32_002813 [Paenibacillus turicensis]|uniref:SMI1/KNR4 family protein n=1 Tax=Paenibacillus turicensis TaxID=160487 RepID=A0ABS4FUM3_9BACL|nr:hypothetical protein [Paenibacillus turicensis]MBP1906164.1 hypothetical protein [Paenibacillus turicensis]
MLPQQLVDFCKSKNWWYEEASQEYEQAFMKLDIPLDSDFAKFYLHVEDGPTFLSRNKELYHIGWFIVNTNYRLNMTSAHETLQLPEAYIPLDSFEGEYGYFYDRQSGEVLRLSLGEEWHQFQRGELKPQWASFNAFLVWYFDL